MKSLKEIRKEIRQIVNEMTISEIEERIKQDELEQENFEIISNDELVYKNVETNFEEVKEEVNIWKNENLLLVA